MEMEQIESEKEGVIKYQLDYQRRAVEPWSGYEELNAWRCILFSMHLIGQDVDRYDGFGYGNISCRQSPGSESFFISGTQTGGQAALSIDDYCRVLTCDVKRNYISAEGMIKPSSEALSHDAVYKLDPNIMCVIHVHNDVLWRCAELMRLPSTDRHVAYGTVAMAEEIACLHRGRALSPSHVFVMGGHLDGIISYGETIERAGAALIDQLSLAIQHYK